MRRPHRSGWCDHPVRTPPNTPSHGRLSSIPSQCSLEGTYSTAPYHGTVRPSSHLPAPLATHQPLPLFSNPPASPVTSNCPPSPLNAHPRPTDCPPIALPQPFHALTFTTPPPPCPDLPPPTLPYAFATHATSLEPASHSHPPLRHSSSPLLSILVRSARKPAVAPFVHASTSLHLPCPSSYHSPFPFLFTARPAS